MADDLHTRYRPESLDDVIGHTAQIKSLRGVVKNANTHAFLFVGPSGVGKTTLARIVAKDLGCAEVREIDAATHTGVDAMREVCSTLSYKAFGGGKKCVIVDEVHRLSASAWGSLLKILEEPPEHVYWMLCTTETGKVPKTIKTRCVEYNLKPVDKNLISELIINISEIEGFKLEDDALDYIARNSDGSVRQALVSLSLCSSCTTRKEVATLLQKAQESDDILSLCRLLVSPQGRTWKKVMAVVDGIDQEPESVRIVVLQYMTKVAMGAGSDDAAAHALGIMEAFSTPFNTSDKKAPLVLAIGEVIYGT